MKLSTFIREMKKEYLSVYPSKNKSFLCNIAGNLSAFVLPTKVNKFGKLPNANTCKEYSELADLVQQEIYKRLKGSATVGSYLFKLSSDRGKYGYPTPEEQHEFRLQLLAELAEWARENENCQ